MAENNNAAIQIGQLNLRIGANGADAGHRVADGVAERLARRIPRGVQRRLGSLSVRVHSSASATEAENSDAIAEAIISALRK